MNYKTLIDEADPYKKELNTLTEKALSDLRNIELIAKRTARYIEDKNPNRTKVAIKEALNDINKRLRSFEQIQNGLISLRIKY